jgi:hypothetical protein
MLWLRRHMSINGGQPITTRYFPPTGVLKWLSCISERFLVFLLKYLRFYFLSLGQNTSSCFNYELVCSLQRCDSYMSNIYVFYRLFSCWKNWLVNEFGFSLKHPLGESQCGALLFRKRRKRLYVNVNVLH